MRIKKPCFVGLFYDLFLFLVKIHHATALSLLSERQLIFLAFERVCPFTEFYFDWRAHYIQRFPEIVHQVSLIGAGQILHLVAVDNDYGRIVAAGVGVLHLDPASSHQWRLMVFLS